MSSLVGKVRDILLDLESERLRREMQACKAGVVCMVQIVRSLERLRTHILAIRCKAHKAAADREKRLESSLKRLYRNIIHTQGCFIERLHSKHEGCISDSRSGHSEASGSQDKPCMSVSHAECSALGSFVALAKSIAARAEMSCTRIVSEQHAPQRPPVCNTQRTVEDEKVADSRALAEKHFGDGETRPGDRNSCKAREQPKSSGHVQRRVKHAHGRLLRHIDCRTEFLCNALLSYYTDSRAAAQQHRDSEAPENGSADGGRGAGKELQARHAIEVLHKNIQKQERRACDAARALLVDILSQGTARDDERFLGILGDTVARFENLENSDFLRLSVQFNLARKYVYDILRLKRGCSVLLSCIDAEGNPGA